MKTETIRYWFEDGTAYAECDRMVGVITQGDDLSQALDRLCQVMALNVMDEYDAGETPEKHVAANADRRNPFPR